jgi:hypothetical protein
MANGTYAIMAGLLTIGCLVSHTRYNLMTFATLYCRVNFVNYPMHDSGRDAIALRA